MSQAAQKAVLRELELFRRRGLGTAGQVWDLKAVTTQHKWTKNEVRK